MTAWECLQDDPQQSTNLQRSDAGLERLHDSGRDRFLRLEQFPVIADIGGGIGAQLSSISMRIRPAEGFSSTSLM